jgi:quercetin dioxygenase-like cupin family protein
MSPRTLLPSDQAQALTVAEAVQTSSAGIVSRTVLQTEELRIVLFAFAEGQELTSHTSRRRAVVQVLEGSCEFFFASAWHTLPCGTLLHLPPEHPHAVRAAHGPFSMLLTLGAERSATTSSSS